MPTQTPRRSGVGTSMFQHMTPGGSQVLAHRPLGGQVWATLKLSCVHFSLCLHAAIFLQVPETHRNIFRPLGRC